MMEWGTVVGIRGLVFYPGSPSKYTICKQSWKARHCIDAFLSAAYFGREGGTGVRNDAYSSLPSGDLSM